MQEKIHKFYLKNSGFWGSPPANSITFQGLLPVLFLFHSTHAVSASPVVPDFWDAAMDKTDSALDHVARTFS